MLELETCKKNLIIKKKETLWRKQSFKAVNTSQKGKSLQVYKHANRNLGDFSHLGLCLVRIGVPHGKHPRSQCDTSSLTCMKDSSIEGKNSVKTSHRNFITSHFLL